MVKYLFFCFCLEFTNGLICGVYIKMRKPYFPPFPSPAKMRFFPSCDTPKFTPLAPFLLYFCRFAYQVWSPLFPVFPPFFPTFFPHFLPVRIFPLFVFFSPGLHRPICPFPAGGGGYFPLYTVHSCLISSPISFIRVTMPRSIHGTGPSLSLSIYLSLSLIGQTFGPTLSAAPASVPGHVHGPESDSCNIRKPVSEKTSRPYTDPTRELHTACQTEGTGALAH